MALINHAFDGKESGKQHAFNEFMSLLYGKQDIRLLLLVFWSAQRQSSTRRRSFLERRIQRKMLLNYRYQSVRGSCRQ